MKIYKKVILFLLSSVAVILIFNFRPENNMKNFYGTELSTAEKNVIENKGTEKPFKGEYTDLFDTGVFICRKYSNPLYFSNTKFHSGCN